MRYQLIRNSSRRAFLGAVTAASYSRVLGANDRVNIGFIGCGLIGLRHIADFKTLPDAALTAVSDVYQPRVEQRPGHVRQQPQGLRGFSQAARRQECRRGRHLDARPLARAC